MAVDEVLSAIFKLKVDIGDSPAKVKQVKDGLTDLNTTASKDNATLKQLTQTIAEIQRVNQIDRLAKDMAGFGDEILSSAEKAEKLAEQLQAIGATQDEVKAAAKAFSEYSNPTGGFNASNPEGLRRTGGALSAIGAGQLGAPVSMLGDLQQVSKELTALAGATSIVDGAASALVPVLGATAGGFLAALAPLAAVGVALAPLIIAFKILADRQEEARKSAELLADVYAKQADAYAVGQDALRERNETTKKAAVDLFNSLNASFLKNVETIAFLNKKKTESDEETAKKIQETIDKTVNEQIALSGSIDILKGNLTELGVPIQGTATGLQRVVVAAKDGEGIFSNLAKIVDTFGEGAKTKLTPFMEALQKAAAEAQKRADQQVKIVDKLNSDLAAMDQKAADDRLNIDKKLVDTLLDINEKAVDNAKSILADLEKQQKQAALKLVRDDATATDKANFDRLGKQIQFQRAEVKAQQDLQAKLKQIRQSAAESQFELALDRQFSELGRSRRGVSGQLNAVVEQANSDQQARLQAAKDKQDDDLRQYLWDHEQRVKSFQQQQSDAIQAANEALKLNEENRKKARTVAQVQATIDITDLQTKLTKEYNAKTAAAKADLELVNKTEAEKQKAYLASYQQAQTLLNGMRQYGGGRAIATRAFGGSLQAGQLSSYNELPNQNESFTTGGQTYALPNGAGFIWPMKAGNVNNNTSNQSAVVNINYSISGNNPEAVAKIVDAKLDQTLKRIFRIKAA